MTSQVERAAGSRSNTQLMSSRIRSSMETPETDSRALSETLVNWSTISRDPDRPRPRASPAGCSPPPSPGARAPGEGGGEHPAGDARGLGRSGSREIVDQFTKVSDNARESVSGVSMLDRIREDISCVFERDPAARSTWEVITCYPGFHALLIHRLPHCPCRLNLRWPRPRVSHCPR